MKKGNDNTAFCMYRTTERCSQHNDDASQGNIFFLHNQIQNQINSVVMFVLRVEMDEEVEVELKKI